MKGNKKYCSGCDNDYYNHDNKSTTGKCWNFESAKICKKFAIGWWIAMDKKENFHIVTTNSCHSEIGKTAFLDKLPRHLEVN